MGKFPIHADITSGVNFGICSLQIIIYKLPQRSREEIEAMLELQDLKQTRFYQEAFGVLHLPFLGYGLLLGLAAWPGNWLGQKVLEKIS